MSKNINKSVNNNFPKPERDISELADQAGKEYRQVAEDVEQTAYELRDVAISRLRNNPYSTSAIIFASGLILGALLRR